MKMRLPSEALAVPDGDVNTRLEALYKTVDAALLNVQVELGKRVLPEIEAMMSNIRKRIAGSLIVATEMISMQQEKSEGEIADAVLDQRALDAILGRARKLHW
jgi:two-component sensor histidine kinase